MFVCIERPVFSNWYFMISLSNCIVCLSVYDTVFSNWYIILHLLVFITGLS